MSPLFVHPFVRSTFEQASTDRALVTFVLLFMLQQRQLRVTVLLAHVTLMLLHMVVLYLFSEAFIGLECFSTSSTFEVTDLKYNFLTVKSLNNHKSYNLKNDKYH